MPHAPPSASVKTLCWDPYAHPVCVKWKSLVPELIPRPRPAQSTCQFLRWRWGAVWTIRTSQKFLRELPYNRQPSVRGRVTTGFLGEKMKLPTSFDSFVGQVCFPFACDCFCPDLKPEHFIRVQKMCLAPVGTRIGSCQQHRSQFRTRERAGSWNVFLLPGHYVQTSNLPSQILARTWKAGLGSKFCICFSRRTMTGLELDNIMEHARKCSLSGLVNTFLKNRQTQEYLENSKKYLLVFF